jgi:starch phosphorylase
VAYFSLEFGVHESLPIYSGGLGVLAGDHVKSASGLGVPMVAVGLFYSEGYFQAAPGQDRSANGGILAYRCVEPADRARPLARRRGGNRPIDTRTGKLLAKVWVMHLGRVNLYLLDCNIDGNSDEDRKLTARLYGGDNRTRIRQELVAGWVEFAR